MGNGGYRQEFSLTEKILGGGQSYVIYISINRIAGIFFHKRSKIGGMIMTAGRKFLYSNRLVIMAADPFDYIQELSGSLVFQEDW